MPDSLRKRWQNSVNTGLIPLPAPATWKDVPESVRIPYALTDAVAHRRAYETLLPRIGAQGYRAIYEIDRAVLPFLTRNEEVGLACDADQLAALSRTFRRDFDAVCQKINALAGYEVNPLSGEQVSDCLFVDLGVTKTRPTKSQKHYTTQDKYLKARKNEHAIILLILEARQLNKYLGTYTEKLPGMLREGRYHPDWRYTRTATGRLAEVVILLIPKHSARGKQIRDCFHATEGHQLVSVDLSQVELRVMAHLSKDRKLIRAYRRGEDVHANVAHDLLGAPRGKDNQDESLHRLPAKCFHPDTEVLTKEGWKPILALTKGEEVVQARPQQGGDVILSWAVPTEVYATAHSSRQLIHLKNEGIDLRVTPDHRMLGWRNDRTPVVTTPEKLNTTARTWANAGMLARQTSSGEGVNLHYIRLAMALQADGTIDSWGAVKWGFSRPRKIRRLEQLLRAANISYRKSRHSNGKHQPTTSIRVRRQRAVRFTRFLDSDKTLPWSMLQMPLRVRETILDEARFWDGCQMPHWRAYQYASFKKKNLDVLQAIAAITNRKTRQVATSLTIRDKHDSRTGSILRTTQYWPHSVACLAVPSTFVLVRDGGVPVICGQTMNFGIINGMSEYGILDQLHEGGQLQWDIDQVREFREDWFKVHVGVDDYWKRRIAEGRAKGVLRGMFGRQRRVDGLWSRDDRIKREAERQCLFAIQGGADDISKLWNARIWRQMIQVRRAEGRRYMEPWVRVHDDTTLEVDERIAKTTRREMLALVPDLLCVPTLAGGKIGERWGGLHK